MSLCPGAAGSVLGPNVCVFNDAMPLATIQSDLDAIANQQIPNQFGPQRYAILFEPGTYGTSADPLNFQVGYYTEVAGLGATPADVIINGSINAYNQCTGTSCVALNNFWRSLSNLTINVDNSSLGCYTNEFWAVSQASPMRRVVVNGATTLMDYCSGPSYASGGFIADSALNGAVINGSQQQFFVRNSSIGSWTNGVLNQVFSGDTGAPATCFGGEPSGCSGGPYSTLSTSPVTEEPPFLTAAPGGGFAVSVPSVLHNSVGPGWVGGADAGYTLPMQKFFVATPSTSVASINQALAHGKDLLVTPGVYDLNAPIVVSRPNTIVLGLGFATLVPQTGQPALVAVRNNGVKIAGLLIDAGPVTSPVLLSLGSPSPSGDSPDNPDLLSDVFFRIGGAAAGSAEVSLLDDASNSILDDIWAWRADHGAGVGWTSNTADTGVVVNGARVTAYGLFVEHYQKYEVIWNGPDGTDIFFQNEMPYDPPSQAAWMASPTQDGYPALLVTDGGTGFQGWGMGSYSFFDQGVDIHSEMAFQSPTSGVSFHDLLTVFLNATSGSGGIDSVINGVGGPSTAANADAPVTVVNYP